MIRRLYGAWKPSEDKLLSAAYEKYGPAWTVVSFDVPSRSPIECRKRHLKLSGVLESPELQRNPDLYHAVFEEGYEIGKDGVLIQFPIEKIEESPLAKLSAGLERNRRKARNRKEGEDWSEDEILVVREGYETYGPNWNFIAKRLYKRTPKEVKDLMQRISIELSQPEQ